jgi:hypothetical protein
VTDEPRDELTPEQLEELAAARARSPFSKYYSPWFGVAQTTPDNPDDVARLKAENAALRAERSNLTADLNLFKARERAATYLIEMLYTQIEYIVRAARLKPDLDTEVYDEKENPS